MGIIIHSVRRRKRLAEALLAPAAAPPLRRVGGRWRGLGRRPQCEIATSARRRYKVVVDKAESVPAPDWGTRFMPRAYRGESYSQATEVVKRKLQPSRPPRVGRRYCQFHMGLIFYEFEIFCCFFAATMRRCGETPRQGVKVTSKEQACYAMHCSNAIEFVDFLL